MPSSISTGALASAVLWLLPSHWICPLGTSRFLGLVHPGRQCPCPRSSRTGGCWEAEGARFTFRCNVTILLNPWLFFAQLAKFEALNQKTHPGKMCLSSQSRSVWCWFPLLQQGASLSGTPSVKSLAPFKFTAVPIKCVNSMEFVYLILLYNTLHLIPSKRNNLAKTSLNSLIRTG